MANMIDVSRMRELIISWFWLKSAISCYIINFKLVFLFSFILTISCLVTRTAARWPPFVHFPPRVITFMCLTCVLLTFPRAHVPPPPLVCCSVPCCSLIPACSPVFSLFCLFAFPLLVVCRFPHLPLPPCIIFTASSCISWQIWNLADVCTNKCPINFSLSLSAAGKRKLLNGSSWKDACTSCRGRHGILSQIHVFCFLFSALLVIFPQTEEAYWELVSFSNLVQT